MKTYDELLQDLVDLKFYEKGLDAVGIFCKAVEGPGGYTERSEFQNGWNAALMQASENACKFAAWYKGLPDQQKKDFSKLLTGGDDIFLSYYDGKVNVSLNMNDTFGYACADAEDVLPEEFALVVELFEKFDYHGFTAWAAYKRKQDPNSWSCEPIKPRITPQYLEAVAYIKDHS